MARMQFRLVKNKNPILFIPFAQETRAEVIFDSVAASKCSFFPLLLHARRVVTDLYASQLFRLGHCVTDSTDSNRLTALPFFKKKYVRVFESDAAALIE